MAAAFDGPSDLALRSGVIAQRLFAKEPAIAMTQAIYGVVGEIYGLGQARGFEAAIARARRASRQSITGVAFVEHLGIWSGSIANLATAAGVLTEYTRFEAEEAMRLLRWRDLCGLLSLAVRGHPCAERAPVPDDGRIFDENAIRKVLVGFDDLDFYSGATDCVDICGMLPVGEIQADRDTVWCVEWRVGAGRGAHQGDGHVGIIAALVNSPRTYRTPIRSRR